MCRCYVCVSIFVVMLTPRLLTVFVFVLVSSLSAEPTDTIYVNDARKKIWNQVNNWLLEN